MPYFKIVEDDGSGFHSHPSEYLRDLKIFVLDPSICPFEIYVFVGQRLITKKDQLISIEVAHLLLKHVTVCFYFFH